MIPLDPQWASRRAREACGGAGGGCCPVRVLAGGRLPGLFRSRPGRRARTDVRTIRRPPTRARPL